MAEQLKMGVLGVGGIAQIAHLPALRKAENVRLTALCDAAEFLLRHPRGGVRRITLPSVSRQLVLPSPMRLSTSTFRVDRQRPGPIEACGYHIPNDDT